MCSKCKTSKPIDEFYFRNKEKGTHQHHCIPCFKTFRDAHYQANKASYKKRCGLRRRQVRLEIKRKVFDYLLKHPCVDCGESNPVVLEFDHRNQSTKLTEVAVLVHQVRPWQMISSEIDKCDVRCANCHRKKTAVQSHCIYLEWRSRLDSNQH